MFLIKWLYLPTRVGSQQFLQAIKMPCQTVYSLHPLPLHYAFLHSHFLAPSFQRSEGPLDGLGLLAAIGQTGIILDVDET
jgi:hypothetical protein